MTPHYDHSISPTSSRINSRQVLPPIASLLTISSTFNSLFKVLCIFPSRYLFAIGLSPLFSFRRNLPPTLGCTPKQPDSTNQQYVSAHQLIGHAQGSHLLWRSVPGDLYLQDVPIKPFTKLQFGDGESTPDFKLELFPLHSQLLRESLLVSFPLLINMLKFSRYPCLI